MNIDRYLGEWNPQFIREVKGRLKPRNLIFTVATSLVVQALVALTFLAQIPTEKTASGHYCLPKGDFTCGIIPWPFWWLDIFQFWSWILPIALILPGCHVLASDLAKEARRGTLDFIRLSPQSSQKFFLGKILGVPILIYVGVGLILPFYLVSAIAAGLVPWDGIISYSLIVICSCFFSYLLALSSGFSKVTQLKSIISGGFFCFIDNFGSAIGFWFFINIYWHIAWQINNSDGVDDKLAFGQWYGLRFYSNIWLLRAFTIATIVTGCYWAWLKLNRHYNNPSSTILSKQQSYGIVACFQLWLLGFMVNMPDPLKIPALIGVMKLNLLFLFMLGDSLLSDFHVYINWAHYCRTAKTKSIVQDLIWGEKSPGIVAIAINLIVTSLIWSVWVFFYLSGNPILKIIASLVFCTNFCLIFAAICLLLLLMQSLKPWVLLILVMPVIAFNSIFFLLFVSVMMDVANIAHFWTDKLTIFDLTRIAHFWTATSTTSIFLGILAQWAILGLIAIAIARQINQISKTPLKILLTSC